MASKRMAALIAVLTAMLVFAAVAVAATIKGTNGNDSLPGTPERDVILLKKGDDGTAALGGNDRIKGNAGNDANAALRPTSGSTNPTGGLSGGEGNDKIDGDLGNDDLSGDAGNDKLRGGKGNDFLTGGDGNDRLKGYRGEDSLNGGSGADYIDARDGRRGGPDQVTCDPSDTVKADPNDVVTGCTPKARGRRP